MTRKITKEMKRENLLVEIGTEEIPARFLKEASLLFRNLLEAFLKENHISYDEKNVKNLFTPRRLTLFIPEMILMQSEKVEKVKGPPVSIALDAQGVWTQAAQAFASKNGVSLDQLIREKTEKGEYLFAEKKIRGRLTAVLLKENLGTLVQKIRFPKSMRWENRDIYFARPIRWLIALLGSKVIPFQVGDLTAGRVSWGYRWAQNPKVTIPRANLSLYQKLLKSKGVYVDIAERLNLIHQNAKKVLGTSLKISPDDEDLLMEVANLVEFPNAAVGLFEKRFLSLPPQVLSMAVKYHQKYIPIYSNGELTDRFLTVFNGPRSIVRTVLLGNERVLRARLTDAAFFWEQDQKKKLSERVEDLKHVVFQEKLGTYFDKKERLLHFVDLLKDQLKNENESNSPNPSSFEKLKRAINLCKADLVTSMVGEFPALQGIIGSEYAHLSGEDREVAQAIGEHYLPLSGSEGNLPKTLLGSYLAFLDKLDSVVASFKMGLMPTGSQDPYGLRRLGSGLLRILYEKGISLTLTLFIERGLKQAPIKDISPEPLLKFFAERLENLFLSLGFHHDLVRAVVAQQSQNPSKAYQILKELKGVQEEPFFQEAITLVERTSNILKGAPVQDGSVDETLLKEPQEIELYRTYQSNYDSVFHLAQTGAFAKATSEYARIFGPCVHAFFDKVLVNVKEEPVRQNRFRLLKKIHGLYANQIADISKLGKILS
ncbi:MAG: glycine--tRNA ligase subunit beta [Chlamydiae bacterium]|nr:glycine--tRNA ligase subunit beta [Chlamydiota bacterium]MBI3266413.1 glycine--tRNA ligase subunit beta [Chlamydiota bacterium]